MQPETPDLRYPIGKMTMPTTFDDIYIKVAIYDIETLPAKLRTVVKGMSVSQLLTPYRPDGWTIAQVVNHVADSHVNAYIRTKLAMTEVEPPIKAYDEKAWAETIDAKSTNIEDSLNIIEGVHARWVEFLKTLSLEDFNRTLVHSENGKMNCQRLLAIYAWHGKHHTAHITSLKEKMGWN